MKIGLKDIFKKIKSCEEIGHAYLIGNIQLESLENDFNEIFSNLLKESNIDIYKNPDIFILNPQNNTIVKDQILNLEKSLKQYSQTNNTKIYIINNCERMNLYAANALLKTLEEPNYKIKAFLLTSNVNAVLPTIKSRCQIINVTHENDKNLVLDFDEKILQNTIDFIKLLELKKIDSIAYTKIYSKKIDKEYLESILKIMQIFYMDCINDKSNININYFKKFSNDITDISNINSINQLSKKSLIINKKLLQINNNLNINLFIDDIIIKFGGKNEN